MPFYVPLGPHGLVFRLGSLLTGILGGFVYWRACRVRARAALIVVPARDDHRPRPAS